MVFIIFICEWEFMVELLEVVGEVIVEFIEFIEIEINFEGEYVVNGKCLVNWDSKILFWVLKDLVNGNMDIFLIIMADVKVVY